MDESTIVPLKVYMGYDKYIDMAYYESDTVFLRCFGGFNPNYLMHVLNDNDPNDESLTEV